MLNPALLRINQDAECRPPHIVRRDSVCIPNPDDAQAPWAHPADTAFVLLRHLTDNEFALFYANLSDADAEVHCEMADMGLHDGRFLRRASGAAEGFVQSAHQGP